MQVINIFPVHNIAYEGTQSMHMFLTHLAEDSALYKTTARCVEGYKILDNSIIECGEPIPIGRVLRIANEIGADEIILPDCLGDGRATVKMAEEYLGTFEIVDPDHRYKLMAVAHGKDLSEWMWCYNQLLANPGIDVIGIPKIAGDLLPGGRPELVNSFCRLDEKPHHLLGIKYSFEELKRYDNPEAIRSVDSCQVSFLALHNLPLDSVRPNGHTVDLKKAKLNHIVLTNKLSELREFI